jgi:hypothetical protein
MADRKGLGGLGILLGLGAAVVLVARAGATPGTASLYGTVNDSVGPLPGVLVTLGGFSRNTDVDGVFTFENIAVGSYDMSFSKAGYETVYR